MMSILLSLLLTVPLLGSTPAGGSERRDTVESAHPLKAAGLTLSVNAAMSLLDRICFTDPCYKSDWNSIRQNLHSDWVWDNDQFFLNQIGHPIQGAMYYDAARASGLGFWSSGLATVLGSVSWEILCENDPPSINDFLSTTAGGMATGEVLWRLYGLAANRKAIDFPIRISAGLGARGLAGIRSVGADAHAAPRSAGAQAFFDIEYGDPFYWTDNRPYDWFTLDLCAGVGSGGTSGVQQVSIIGRLYGKSLQTCKGDDLTVGLFQHFNYYDSPEMDLSESNSFGPGIVMRLKDERGVPNTELQAHLGAIIMGGVQSEYYSVLKRRYNMASGLSFHGSISHDWGKKVFTSLKYDHYQLFTSKEYNHSFLDAGGDPQLLDARGNKQISQADIFRMLVDIRCSDSLAIRIAPSVMCRRSLYSYHPDIFRSYADVTVGLCWKFTNQ